MKMVSCVEHEAVLIPTQRLELVAAPIHEDEEMGTERVLAEHLADPEAQAINRFAQVHRLAG